MVVSEGARPKGGDVVVKRIVKESTIPVRLGGIGLVLGSQLEKLTGISTRTVVLGHLQRGGSPTPFDRILATRLGAKAADMIEKKEFGKMAGIKGSTLCAVPLEIVAKGPRNVPPKHDLIRAARSIGTSFGT